MSAKGNKRRCFFYPSLERAIIYETSGKELSFEEHEFLQLYVNHKQGFPPNSWHYFYEEGQTMLYNEHIEDIKTVEKMFYNKHKIENAKKSGPTHNPLKAGSGGKRSLGGKFYGKKTNYRR